MEYFDAVYCICMADRPRKRDFLLKQIKHFYPDLKPIVFDAVNTTNEKWPGHHIGCALSHREIVTQAKKRKLKNVLVLEEDVVFRKDTVKILDNAWEESRTKIWDLFYLGATCWRDLIKRPFPMEKNCNNICKISGCTSTHGLAYGCDIYDLILRVIPDNINEVRKWLAEVHGIDQWLRSFQNTGNYREYFNKLKRDGPVAYMTWPKVASQPVIMGKNHYNKDDPEPFITNKYLNENL